MIGISAPEPFWKRAGRLCVPPLGDDYEGRSQARQDMEALFWVTRLRAVVRKKPMAALTEQPEDYLAMRRILGFDVVFSRGLAADVQGVSGGGWAHPHDNPPLLRLKGLCSTYGLRGLR